MISRMSATTIKKKSEPITPSPADAARSAYSSASTALAQNRQTLATATAAHNSLIERRDKGDATVTATEVREAREEVEHWTALVSAARRNMQLAERRLVNEDTDLAAAVAPVLTEMVGVPVIITTTRPSYSREQAPVVYLVQTKPTKAAPYTGIISGDVSVVFVRSAIHRGLAIERAETLAGAHGVRLSARAGGSQEMDDLVIDSAQLTVLSAWPKVPVIAANTDDGFRINSFISGVGEIVSRPTRSVANAAYRGVRMGSGSTGYDDSATGAHVISTGSVVSDDTDADGLRHRKIAVTLVAEPGRHCLLNTDEVVQSVIRGLERMKDTCATAIGRIVSVDIGAVTPTPDRRPSRTISVIFDFVSRVPVTS